MSTGLSFSELIEYTDWERSKWQEWLRRHGDEALATSAGPNGDGRFQTIGDLIKHIFSAEKRYIDRLSNRPITDAAAVSNSNVEALFQFGRQSRADLKEFVASFPSDMWDEPQEFTLMNRTFTATPRKIVIHVLMHEVRHWAQIGTMFRISGRKGEFHDFLFSPVLGQELKIGA